MTESIWLHDPIALWHETGLGREEFLQKLLSTLVFGHANHRWNRPDAPSQRGDRYLRELLAMHFGEAPREAPDFVDEFELPRRHDDERAGWPDQAAVWSDRLFLIELKTERGSHRPGQIAHYIDLAVHHHHARSIDALYLTPEMEVAPPPQLPTSTRYGHASWKDVARLISEVWGESEVDWERTIAALIVEWSGHVEQGTPPPPKVRSGIQAGSRKHVADDALQIAAEVQTSGDQRALNVWPGSVEELEELRLELRSQFRKGTRIDRVAVENVLPWLWSAGSSGGTAMTDAGRTHGYELRLSRYSKPLWNPSDA